MNTLRTARAETFVHGGRRIEVHVKCQCRESPPLRETMFAEPGPALKRLAHQVRSENDQLHRDRAIVVRPHRTGEQMAMASRQRMILR